MGVRGRGVRGGPGILPVCVLQMENCWTSEDDSQTRGGFGCQFSVGDLASRLAWLEVVCIAIMNRRVL